MDAKAFQAHISTPPFYGDAQLLNELTIPYHYLINDRPKSQ